MTAEQHGAAVPRSEVERLASVDAGAVAEVAREAGKDSGVEVELLGGYLDAVLTAARSARSLGDGELERFDRIGEDAAERGIDLPALLDLYLSATWRLWREIPAAGAAKPEALAAVADSLFRSSDDTAQALGRGYQRGQRLAIRREEAKRREFADDLLSGTGDLEQLRERAAAFGFHLPAQHRVVVARTDRPVEEGGDLHIGAEIRVRQAFGRDDLVVATKEGGLVCVVPSDAPDPAARIAEAVADLGSGGWRVGEGRVEPGPAGVARSYRQAREALELASRLERTEPVARYDELLVYHVLLGDRVELKALVDRTLGGLRDGRGGAAPFVDTLEAYFAEGGNVSATARRLHLSARAVSHRLQTITARTGLRPHDAEDRFLLEVAVRATRLLGAE
jgi:DNA-binding PucR family transcriptional regulator